MERERFMQDNTKNNNTTLTQFVLWLVNNPGDLEKIMSPGELNADELLVILKTLHEYEVHILFLAALVKVNHRTAITKIVDKAVCEFWEKKFSEELIKQLESSIIQHFESHLASCVM